MIFLSFSTIIVLQFDNVSLNYRQNSEKEIAVTRLISLVEANQIESIFSFRVNTVFSIVWFNVRVYKKIKKAQSSESAGFHSKTFPILTRRDLRYTA